MCLAGGSLWTNALQFSLKEFKLVAILKIEWPLRHDCTLPGLWPSFKVFKAYSSKFCISFSLKLEFLSSSCHPCLCCTLSCFWQALKLPLTITEQSSKSDLICALPCLRSYLVSLGIQELTVLTENLFFSEVYRDCGGLHITAFLSLQ